jgi:hypothetical protein
MKHKKTASQKRTPGVSVRLNRDSEKHSQIKRIRRSLQSKEGEDLTIIQTYERVIAEGAEVMEQKLK